MIKLNIVASFQVKILCQVKEIARQRLEREKRSRKSLEILNEKKTTYKMQNED